MWMAEKREAVGVSSGYANCMFAGCWRTLILTLVGVQCGWCVRDASLALFTSLLKIVGNLFQLLMVILVGS